MAVVVIENGLFFPVLKPPIAGDQTVVLVDLALTVFPVVELAGTQAQPTKELTRRELRPLGPVVDIVDDFVTRVMGNPGSLQSSPSSFFSCTCSCINSAMTSFFLTSFVWSFSRSLA